MLGQQLGTMINEVVQPGIYKVDWDADQYASGMYIYRLEAVDPKGGDRLFLESKKMVLLK
jgi:hypothetical protein